MRYVSKKSYFTYSSGYTRVCCLLFLIFYQVTPIIAQIKLKAVSSENRISENAARSIIKDKDGYIWVATIDGLNRYDGYKFTTYRHNPLDSNSISANFIEKLHVDEDGRFWVATFNGLDRYFPDSDSFKKVDIGQKSTCFMTDIAENNQYVYFSSYDGGIAMFDKKNNTFLRSFWFHPEDNLLEVSVTALQTDTFGCLWIGYQNKGLSFYSHGKMEHHLQDEVKKGVMTGMVNDIEFDRDGNLWLGTTEGIFHYNLATRSLKKYLNKHCRAFNWINGRLYANVFFIGPYVWDEKNDTFVKEEIYYEEKEVEGDIQIYIQDESGILWATFRGLAKYDQYETRFNKFQVDPENPYSLNSREIVGLDGDDYGNLAVATQYGGINYYDADKNIWLNWNNHPPFDNFSKEIVLKSSILLDRTFIWFEGYDAQLCRMNKKSGDLQFWNLAHLGQSISCIEKDEKGRYWLANGNLYQFDQYGSFFKKYSFPEEEEILAIGYDDNDVFVASHLSIYKYNSKIDSFEWFANLDIKGLSSNISSSILLTEDYIWIGKTYGLLRVNKENRIVKLYTSNDGLPNDRIASIASSSGYLWIGSNNGLTKFDYKNEKFKNFDKLDGLQDEIFLSRAVHKDQEGNLYFGGINGINYFHPDSLNCTNPNPPKIMIKEARVLDYANNQIMKINTRALQGDHQKGLKLNYRNSSISFDLLALSFSQSRKNQYAYMIDGVDVGWNYTGDNSTSTYARLPRDQQLTFIAKAANHDGVWSAPVSMKIFVTPPFWETKWFRLSVILTMMGVVYLLYWLRIKNIRKRNKFLESEVEKQTTKIRNQANSLLEVNKELKKKARIIQQKVHQLDQLRQAQSQFFIGLSHEFKTPITLLLGYLDEMGGNDQPEVVVTRMCERMRMNAQQLLHLVDQLMDTAKLESGQYRLNPSDRNLIEEIETIVQSFQILAQKKGIKLSLTHQIPAKIYHFDNDVLQKVLYNLLSNAIKFTTESGEVAVGISEIQNEQNSKIEITVRDNGIGIPEHQLTYIFQRFYQVDDGQSYVHGTGIGLSLVKRLVGIHGGKILVDSKLGKGSTFRVLLPIKKSSRLDLPSKQNGPAEVPAALFPEPISFNKVSNTNHNHPLLLIIEDNPETRALIHHQLNDMYNILEAENGKKGLEIAIAEVPDIIVSDVKMPEMNGLAFCKFIKEDKRTSHIQVIMLSAQTHFEQRLEGLKSGADVYLSKPFKKDELRTVLQNLLSTKKKMHRRFLKEVSFSLSNDELNEPDHQFLLSLSNYINEHLTSDQLDADHVCKSLGVSKTQMYRKLKALVGMSITEFIRDYRLKKAYQLLLESNLNVSEVIHQTGFNSRSYFYQSFKDKFGNAPSDLLKHKV